MRSTPIGLLTGLCLSICVLVFYPQDQHKAEHIKVANPVVEQVQHPDLTNTIVSTTHQQPELEQVPAESAEALFKQAMQIRQCRNVPRTDKAFNQWLDEALSRDEVHTIVETMKARYQRCLGDTNRDENYVEKLMQAAQMGSDEAADTLWRLAPTEVHQALKFSTLTRDEQVARMKAFTAQKYLVTEQVALLGGEKATLQLIRGYQYLDPDTGGQNYIQALAYSHYFLQTRQDSEVYSRVEWTRRYLEQRMTLDEITQAQQLANKLQHRE
ncbi:MULTISPECIES: hypothetical protein [unclassified Pseudoalteromonas]|uniref:hypothetical protein n=1 Tax=unclassified Pseudoalteromonas TaxID=194690 RepID=UPI002096915A|nr:hypothetical protein [Pseudoalteromonas sp. XMcav2-N]MCO7187549.1 hypothetical protein [Pseudoalteromonas sp. XMcav2-N]